MQEREEKAPICDLLGSDGQTHRIGGANQCITVVYFYPRDMTPGCTTEALEFNALLPEFHSHNAQVYGISGDGIESHQRFCQKHDLSVVLLSDSNRTALQAYGAWGKRNLYGRVFIGILRQTFVIDPQGFIFKKWVKVRAKGHAQEVLQAVKELTSEPIANAP